MNRSAARNFRTTFLKSCWAVSAALILFACAIPVQADIYQWQYINGDPNQGKEPSTIVCPGGAGVSAVPNTDLSSRDLTRAYLIGAQLQGATAGSSIFTDADLSGADLTGAKISYVDLLPFYSNLTRANLSNANLTGTTFFGANLTTANLSGCNLVGANFSSSMLTSATLTGATVTETNFAASNLTANQLFSTLSYQAKDLHGIILSFCC